MKQKFRNMEVVDAYSMTKFIQCFLWCAYYQKSPDHMIKNQSLFPGFDAELRALGGIAKFNKVKALFKSPKKQLETSWNVYYATIPDVRKLVRIVSENCSSVVSSGNPNDITIDDDRWKFNDQNREPQ
jgi:hypothetical protein